jgi:hypothetical protein
MINMLVRSANRTSGTTGNFSMTWETNQFNYVRFVSCEMQAAGDPLFITTNLVPGSDNGLVDIGVAYPGPIAGAIAVLYTEGVGTVRAYQPTASKKYRILNPTFTSTGVFTIVVRDSAGAVVNPAANWTMVLEFTV